MVGGGYQSIVRQAPHMDSRPKIDKGRSWLTSARH
jgi:hypothetical protein